MFLCVIIIVNDKGCRYDVSTCALRMTYLFVFALRNPQVFGVMLLIFRYTVHSGLTLSKPSGLHPGLPPCQESADCFIFCWRPFFCIELLLSHCVHDINWSHLCCLFLVLPPVHQSLGWQWMQTHRASWSWREEKKSLIPPDLHSKDCLASAAAFPVYILETASLHVSKVPLLSFKQDFI